MKRLALLVPCYNAARFVAPFLAMVRAQTRPYDEIVFFDDGSTDETVALLKAEGVRVLRGERNCGAAHARNRLLTATDAPYVHFHDIDDELHPEFVASLLADAQPNRAACCAYQSRWWPDGELQREYRFRDLPVTGPRIDYFLNHNLHFNAVIYPREVLLQAGSFEEKLRLSEDVHLLLRVATSDVAFAYHDRVLTTWRLRRDSTYHAAGPLRQILGFIDAVADLCERWPPALRRELAPTLLERAWSLHQMGERAHAQRVAHLAETCGARVIANRGHRIKWLTALVGPSRFYRFFPPAIDYAASPRV